MLSKRLTFILVPSDNGSVREYSVGRALAFGVSCFLCSIIFTLSYFSFAYFVNQDQSQSLELLRIERDELNRLLASTDKQVLDMEVILARLIEDDNRLRDYHMMETVSVDLRMGGVGGTEDLPVSLLTNSKFGVNLRDPSSGIIQRLQRLQQMVLFQEQSFAEIEREFFVNEGDLRHFPTIWPVPQNRTWISSEFGYRNDPFTGRKARHLGIDFAGRMRTPVYATGDGVVTHAYSDRRLGNTIVIEHSAVDVTEDGTSYIRKGVFRTEYGHLDEYVVEIDQRVRRGEKIGFLGNTGRSTGPHLHYSVRYIDRNKGGTKGYVDPKDFLLDHVEVDANTPAVGWSME